MRRFHFKAEIQLDTLRKIASYLISVLMAGMFATDVSKDIAQHSSDITVHVLCLTTAIVCIGLDIAAICKES